MELLAWELRLPNAMTWGLLIIRCNLGIQLERLDLNYKSTNNDLGRRFCGLDDTVLPLCSKAQSIQVRRKHW